MNGYVLPIQVLKCAPGKKTSSASEGGKRGNNDDNDSKVI